jgi:serine/threonine protein kinase
MPSPQHALHTQSAKSAILSWKDYQDKPGDGIFGAPLLCAAASGRSDEGNALQFSKGVGIGARHFVQRLRQHLEMIDIDGVILCPYCFSEQDPDSLYCSECGRGGDVETDNALPLNTMLMGRYITGETLGRGGFGITYAAYDLIDKRKAAVKEYFPEGLGYRHPGSESVHAYAGEKGSSYEEGRRLFYEEAKALASLESQAGIAKVCDCFYQNNTAYYAMEFLEGASLKEDMGSYGGRLPWKRAMDIAQALSEALSAAHALGLCHGYIRPENVFVTSSGQAKLLNFGGARRFVTARASTVATALSDAYTPVEVFAKGELSPQSDFYSLGAVLYAALTGIEPQSAIARLESDSLLPPGEAAGGEGIPARLSGAVMKMLALRQEDRFSSVSEIRKALKKQKTPPKLPEKPSEAEEWLPEKGKAEERKKPTASFSVRPKPEGVQYRFGAKIGKQGLWRFVKKEPKKKSGSAEPKRRVRVPAKFLAAFGAAFLLCFAAAAFFYPFDVFEKPFQASVGGEEAKGEYTGKWRSFKPNGPGAFTLTESSGTLKAGSSYNGVFASGLLRGEGFILTAEGDRYSGAFAKGVLEGEGTVLYANGNSYAGQFKAGKIEGKGVFKWADGMEYEGDFVDGSATGQGTFAWANGDSYTGGVENGMRNGYGVYHYADGSLFKGDYQSDMMHGYGEYYGPDGKLVMKGTWSKGLFLE